MTVAVIELPNVDLLDLEPWEEFALCSEVGGSHFYPPDGVKLGAARFVCRRCPVTGECLDFAFRHMNGDTEAGWWGVWGGTGELERRAMRKALLEAAA